MGSYVVDLREIDGTQVALAGGKGASLGELTRLDGVAVPAGVCVTTDAYRRVVAATPAVGESLARLAGLRPDDRAAIAGASAGVRASLDDAVIPDDVTDAVTRAVDRLGDGAPLAVRSSATAEDQPTASFAGQHDTYLNVVGPDDVLRHVRRCWASLFTERAVTYRLQHDVDHDAVAMAVVVQRMVEPRASGVLFTADPVTGNRRVAVVEAVYGLGEALVSGRVNADVLRVRDRTVIDREIAAKPLATRPRAGGGTHDEAVEPGRRDEPALTDEQAITLVELGRRIEAHAGQPQDIEWCLAGDGTVHIVQSRPVTTLFPVPEAPDDANRVYISVGHQQMMTDPMTALGLSVWQMTTARPMAVAGGRLFVDVTQALATPEVGPGLVQAMGRSDPLIGDALRTVVERGDFVRPIPGEPPATPPPGAGPPSTEETDPALVAELVERHEASLAELRRAIRTVSGPDLLDFIRQDIDELKRLQFDPRSFQAILAGMEATWWLNDRLHEWLGERDAADTLARSVHGNVTTEMGLALLDVADAVRPHPEVVEVLRRAADGGSGDGRSRDGGFLEELDGVPGGAGARRAIGDFLDRYGVRGNGEIDLTRPRFRERPSMLVPLILSHVATFEAGAGPRLFEEGRREAEAKAREVLERVRALPDGEAKAAETERMIDRVRAFNGYREYPKFAMVSRYSAYKEALLGELGRLVREGVLAEAEDGFHLTFDELHEVVRTRQVDHDLIRRRREELRAWEALTPPRVLTSEGEALTGRYRRDDVPAGALVGLPVSAGTVEGRARVVHDLAEAAVEPGDILVTAYTDPSWSPLFVSVAGVVTEVGGLMTHGAVVAREYGLPAVVGVEHATRLIPDGQRIRVHGTDGYVQLLPA